MHHLKTEIQVKDLRTALELLSGIPDQLIETDVAVDQHAQLAGVYRHIGAGGTIQRPTQEGPAIIFNCIKGHPDAKILIGLLASRKRVGYLLGAPSEKLGFLLNEAAKNPIAPVVIPNAQALCQEVVHYATDEGFDIRQLLPAPTNTEEDAGPYITLGMCYASDPETGESDVTIHRLCLQSKDEMTMFFTPGARHLDVFRIKAEKEGKPLPISISIGVDPAIEIGACFEPPTTPIGFNELSIAGGIRKSPVELVNCLTIQEKAIANAEYVIEGELLPGVRMREDANTLTGKAMPEFPGYTGFANPQIPIIKVKAVTHRKNPIMQTCIGPSEEHVSMVGIPTEASILQMVERAMPGRLLNVYAHSAGGGKYMAILQLKKSVPSDEGRQRQAALLAFSSFSELKHVILVDEDVDPFDSTDVLWAMNTRYQGDIDTIFIPGVRCHPLDPSENALYNPMLRDTGITCKTIFDCTVPFHLKEQFTRSKFMDVDPRPYAPHLFDTSSPLQNQEMPVDHKIPDADISYITNKWMDIPYALTSIAQKLDIYLPEVGEGPFPVILSIHGGAFMMGDKRDIQMNPHLKALKKGYAVVGINYRLSGEAIFPAGLMDIKAAIRWVRANAATYKLNGDKLATWGGSAGGNYSAMICTTAHHKELEDLSLGNEDFPCHVQASVDWFGPTDFLKMDPQFAVSGHGVCDHNDVDSPESRYLGGKITEIPHLVPLANPMTYIHEDMPPIMIQHGSIDHLVPTQQSIIFAEAIEKRIGKERVYFEILEGADHGGPEFDCDENVEKVIVFLDRYLK